MIIGVLVPPSETVQAGNAGDTIKNVLIVPLGGDAGQISAECGGDPVVIYEGAGVEGEQAKIKAVNQASAAQAWQVTAGANVRALVVVEQEE